MSLLSIDELKSLVEQSQGLCVSLYIPMVRLGSETQQNPIRFKNMIKQAEAQLEAHQMRPTNISKFLQPAMDLDEEDFWQHQDEGLAIFLAEGFFRYYRLPLQFQELAVVSNRFHLKPLLQLLTGDGEFYILTLSQQGTRVLQGSRYSVREITVEGMPGSMDEALQYDETAKDGQFRIGTTVGNAPGGGAAAPGIGSYHGQGSPDQDDIKQDLLQYFHQVDAALHNFLRNKQAPLVLAGVDYLLPVYHEANTYPFLLDEGIPHNAKLKQPEELHNLAWAIVEPQFQQAQQSAIERYYELSNTGKTSADLKEVVPAAYYGRVEQLFVAVDRQQWGNFDPDAMELQMHDEPEPQDEDLLNSAAIQTLLSGGTIYAVQPEQVPADAPLAAVFRY